MKFIKTYRLFEENLEDEGGVFKAFFGSDKKPSKFTDKLAVDDKEDGPGIMLSSDENDARKFGPYVTEVTLDLKRVVPVRGSTKKVEMLFLMNNAPEMEDSLHKFDKDDPREAFFKAADKMMHGQTPHNVFHNVWHVFYQDDLERYMKNMRGLGYDGCVVPMRRLTRYVVYNPERVKISE
jgi:hypothetical protein